mgnify:FL=1
MMATTSFNRRRGDDARCSLRGRSGRRLRARSLHRQGHHDEDEGAQASYLPHGAGERKETAEREGLSFFSVDDVPLFRLSFPSFLPSSLFSLSLSLRPRARVERLDEVSAQSVRAAEAGALHGRRGRRSGTKDTTFSYVVGSQGKK